MKENKSAKLSIRLTDQEKSELKAYCEKYNLKISQFIRDMVFEKIRKEQE